MSAEDAGLLVTTVYAVTLIGAILGDALRTQRTKDERTMITKLRSLWHRLFPVRHPTPEEQARDDLQRQLRWRVDARLERAIRANRLPEDDARAVRREYKRLVAQRGSYGALAAAVDYAATLAPKEKGRASCREGLLVAGVVHHLRQADAGNQQVRAVEARVGAHQGQELDAERAGAAEQQAGQRKLDHHQSGKELDA